MKRFFINLGLGILGFLGILGMTGNALLEGHFFLQVILTFASFYLAVVCIRELAIRLAAHLPDEEV